MNKEMLLSVARRFVRVFIAGAIANMSAVAAQTSIQSLADIKTWVVPIIVAGIAGGLAALDKALRYEVSS